ncbi:MAG: HAD hydrolase-like protein [Candidatus Pacebacteria bacterium]|nr:HAD hydrolase-like protein [Candidatus Paceibacterota bacterium]
MKTIFVDLGGTLFLNEDGQAVLNQSLFDILAKHKNNFRLVILSDTTYDVTVSLFDMGITSEFNPLVITKHLYNIDKYDPTTYLFACEKAGVDPEQSLLIDNESNFVLAAKKAGLKTVSPDDSNLEEKILAFL